MKDTTWSQNFCSPEIWLWEFNHNSYLSWKQINLVQFLKKKKKIKGGGGEKESDLNIFNFLANRLLFIKETYRKSLGQSTQPKPLFILDSYSKSIGIFHHISLTRMGFESFLLLAAKFWL